MNRAGRIAGLDGVRGLAALFVVVHHTFLRAFPGYPVDHAPWWAGWLIYGRFAVVVFIVLSGFSLAVSPARHGWRLGGNARFARRRAWRILPAYWAALLLSLLLDWFLRPPPAPDGRAVAVYGLLVQDLFAARNPNKAFWSIAVEAQLYVVFPLLLLLVRRAGGLAMVATVAVPVVAFAVLGPPTLVDRMAPDLAVLFAVGVLAAGILTAGARWPDRPWGRYALAAALPVLAVVSFAGSVWTIGHLFWIDLALGPAIGCLLAAITTGRPAPLVKTLDTAPLRGLGRISYSLYLIHYPIVVVLWDRLIAGRVAPGAPAFLVALVTIVPVTVLAAWAFASVFELPFQRHRSWAALKAAVLRVPAPSRVERVGDV